MSQNQQTQKPPNSVYLIGGAPRTPKEVEEEKKLRYDKVKDDYLDLKEDQNSRLRRARVESYRIGGDEQQNRINQMKASIQQHLADIARLEAEIDKAEQWLHGEYGQRYGGEEAIARGYKEVQMLKEYEEYFDLKRNDHPQPDAEDEDAGEDAARAEMPRPFSVAMFGEPTGGRGTTAALAEGQKAIAEREETAPRDDAREASKASGLFVSSDEEA